MEPERGTPDRGPRHPAGHAALRGVVAAMSMTGMRALTTRLGLLTETPPEIVVSEGAPTLLRRLTPDQAGALLVLLHWAYGSASGALFGALPDRLRLRPWAGPCYGAGMWLVFEAAVVPLLGMNMGHRPHRERLVLAADHLLYGAVLGELRRRPRA